jgi:hypothetical protein
LRCPKLEHERHQPPPSRDLRLQASRSFRHFVIEKCDLRHTADKTLLIEPRFKAKSILSAPAAASALGSRLLLLYRRQSAVPRIEGRIRRFFLNHRQATWGQRSPYSSSPLDWAFLRMISSDSYTN